MFLKKKSSHDEDNNDVDESSQMDNLKEKTDSDKADVVFSNDVDLEEEVEKDKLDLTEDLEGEQKSFFKKWRWLLVFTVVVLFFIIINFLLQFLSNWYFQDKVLFNIWVNDIEISLDTYDEVERKLNTYWDNYWDNSELFIKEVGEKAVSIEGEEEVYSEATMTGQLPMTLNWSKEFCKIDDNALQSYILDYGKNMWWGRQLFLTKDPKSFTFPLNCEKSNIEKFLKENLEFLEKPAKNAYYEYNELTGELAVYEGEMGRVIKYDLLVDQVLDKLKKMEELEVSLEWENEDPALSKVNLENHKEEYLKLMNAESIRIEWPISVNNEGGVAVERSYDYMRETNPENIDSYYDSETQKYIFKDMYLRSPETNFEEATEKEKYTTIDFLTLSEFKDNLYLVIDETDKAYFQIKEEYLEAWLDELNEENKVEPRNAVLELEKIVDEEAEDDSGIIDGESLEKQSDEISDQYQVIDFVSPTSGRGVDIEKSKEIINETLKLTELPESVLLPEKILEPQTEGFEDNALEITELVGLGVSNFAGSPSNRIHNIWVGAEKLSGILVAPGEEWHTVDNLKPFNSYGGYRPELVIKGDKTIPEYGGGLCQVATTLFRAAIDGGFNITQRRPHGYNVSYYKPIGTDATIYDPYPDFRFINDTGNYILVQSYVVGANLYVEFWGVRDGRTVELTPATPYNWTGYPAPRYVENPDLAPGVVQQVEYAHQGVTGEFWSRVTYPDGTVVFKKWISKYPAKAAIFEKGPEPGAPVDDELDGSDGGNIIIRPGDEPPVTEE